MANKNMWSKMAKSKPSPSPSPKEVPWYEPTPGGAVDSFLNPKPYPAAQPLSEEQKRKAREDIEKTFK